jgi:hypothetical protein
LTAAGAAVLFSGCTRSAPAAGSPAAAPAADRVADRRAVARAGESARTLHRANQAVAEAGGTAAALHRRLAADHRAHLDALGLSPDPDRAGAAPTPSPASGAALAANLIPAAERDGSRQALADLPDLSPAVAVLLARIAASRAVHTDLLTGSGTGSGTGSAERAPAEADAAERATLGYLVAAEHAAVYGYGTLVGRLSTTDRGRGRAAWAWHTDRRDAYAGALAQAGGRVPAARPAYDLGTADDPGAAAAAAAALAGRIEQGVLTTLLNGIAQVGGGWRAVLGRDAVEAARRLEQWAGPVGALPL